MDGLFSVYKVFNKIVFDYLKAYHLLSPKPDRKQVLMLLTLAISYDLPGLDIKIPENPLKNNSKRL